MYAPIRNGLVMLELHLVLMILDRGWSFESK